MKFICESERELCKIDCECTKNGKKPRGDTVTLTDRRVYCCWVNLAGHRVQKVIDLREVQAVESGTYGFVRYPVIGLLFLLLCCVLSAYLYAPHHAALAWTALAVAVVGAAFFAACIVLYFRHRLTAVVLYYGCFKLRLSSPGLDSEEIESFCTELFAAKDALLDKEKNAWRGKW